MPDISIIPIFTPIPIAIEIITISKPMQREEGSKAKTIFPAPPMSPTGVELKLMREVWITIKSWQEKGVDAVSMLGGFGHPRRQETTPTSPQVKIMDKVWVPEISSTTTDQKRKGTWRQGVTFRSTFALTCSPGMWSKNMNMHVRVVWRDASCSPIVDSDSSLGCQYSLCLKLAFPGIGNNLKLDIPIDVVSSLFPPGLGSRWQGPAPELAR